MFIVIRANSITLCESEFTSRKCWGGGSFFVEIEVSLTIRKNLGSSFWRWVCNWVWYLQKDDLIHWTRLFSIYTDDSLWFRWIDACFLLERAFPNLINSFLVKCLRTLSSFCANIKLLLLCKTYVDKIVKDNLIK